jgi:glutaredoxin 3
LEAKVQGLIKENKVMMFSKDYCPYCAQAKSLLDSKGVKYEVVEMDLIPDGKDMHKALKKLANQNTVPCTYVNGRKVGGCDDLKAAVANGKFDKMLAM